LYILLIIENTKEMPHLKNVGWCFVIELSRIGSHVMRIGERNMYP